MRLTMSTRLEGSQKQLSFFGSCSLRGILVSSLEGVGLGFQTMSSTMVS